MWEGGREGGCHGERGRMNEKGEGGGRDGD